MKITTYDDFNKIDASEKDRVANFIFTHLEKYGDPLSAVKKAIDYAAKDRPSLGGYVFLMKEDNKIVSAIVMNKTGMDEYIPENILVYIATHKDYRGNGIGQKLLQYAIDNSEGDIALHCDFDNPAKFLYQKLGFTNPYLEMRLKKQK
ncbi:GNAT family N-acetyltransferase [Winogradskyella sp. R77965]|uniref:GNAT family N-acetyltransferase n=1 Tax=Winogradskyella sp. R77965 TaxID=3093872 RepID=UPI0037DD1E91